MIRDTTSATRGPDASAAGGTAPGRLSPRADWVPWLIALAVFAAYTAISLSRYFRLAPGSWDLGIFTEYVRQIAHLRAPVVNIHGSGFNLLGDHFQPIVGLIAPLFVLFPSAATLLVVQALLTAVSVIPVSRAAAARLGTGAGRMIGAAYGVSWGLQQMIDFDFHEIAFAVPLLACSLSALSRGRVRAAAVWALPLVFVKEDQGFTVAAIGILIGAMSLGRARADGLDRAALRWGSLLTVWGLAWSFLAIAVIIPHFNPLHQYPYWPDGGVLSPGGAHVSAPSVLAQFGHSYVPKLRTTLLILLPVAFLALGSPLTLVAIPSLALRFVSTNSAYWGADYHYNATVMPIVFLGAIDTLARIRAYRARAAGGAGSPALAVRLAGAGGHARPPGAHAGDRGGDPGAVPAQRPVARPDLPDERACPGRGRRPGPGARRHHRGGHAYHAGPAGGPGRYLLDRRRREPGSPLHRVRRAGQRLEPPAQRSADVRRAAPPRGHLPGDL